MGLIGSGARGREDWTTFLKQPDFEPVAVCDVYDPFREKGIALTGGRAEGYKDFRRLLEQKDIDAVIVATPDHWHALSVATTTSRICSDGMTPGSAEEWRTNFRRVTARGLTRCGKNPDLEFR